MSRGRGEIDSCDERRPLLTAVFFVLAFASLLLSVGEGRPNRCRTLTAKRAEAGRYSEGPVLCSARYLHKRTNYLKGGR